VHNARIEVLEESWQEPFHDEKQLLGLQPSARALVREVLILSDNTIWMFARTVIPRTLLEGELAQLAHLKTKPIGSILFNDKNIKRGSFLFARLHEAMDLYHSVKKYIPEEERLVRRSLFSFKEKSLLLTEVFMPELTTL
jgi:chorismate--pyruvate lyase